MEKNGTPRQANVCQSSQAVIEISKDLYNNPEHSLEGLSEYSHLWYVIFRVLMADFDWCYVPLSLFLSLSLCVCVCV